MTNINSLPKFLFSRDNLDYSQEKIIVQLQKYVDFKYGKTFFSNKLSFKISEGLCSGLVSYWLYCKCNREEDEFIDQLEYVLTWNNTAQLDGSKIDPKIEDFMTRVGLLHFDQAMRVGIKQASLNHSFALLLPENARQVTAAEFESTFVYNVTSLTQLLTDTVYPNKMVRFSNAYHTIGLVYNNGVYYLYDPDSRFGPAEYTDPTALSKAIFAALAKFCKSEDYIALNMSIYDLEFDNNALQAGYEPPQAINYPNANLYNQQFMADEDYKKSVLINPQILDMALWYNNSSIVSSLINDGLSLNMRGPRNKPLLESAVTEGDVQVLFELLAAGANPNVFASTGQSLIEYAIKSGSVDAIIVLLGFGAEFTKSQFDSIYTKYSFTTARQISNRGLELNKKLLKASDSLDIKSATPAEILAYLKHAKLKAQLGRQVNTIDFHEIVERCQKVDHTDLFDLAQEAQILELLKYHLPTYFDKEGDDELLNNFVSIEQSILSKNPQELSQAELQEIDIISEHLKSISTHWLTIYPRRMYICYRAASIQQNIETHLLAGGIGAIKDKITDLQVQAHQTQRNYLFFTPQKNKTEPEVSFTADVAPLLKF